MKMNDIILVIVAWIIAQVKKVVKIVKKFWADCKEQSALADAARANEYNRQWCAYLEANEYLVFSTAMFECLRENGTRLGLEQPVKTERIFPPVGQRVIHLDGWGYCYCYLVRRAWTANIRDGKFQTVYSDVYAKQIGERLGKVISEYAENHGVYHVVVVNVKDSDDNRVLITLGVKNGGVS